MPLNVSTRNLTITNPLVLYRSLIATNRIRPDPAQHRLALHLQTLYETLKDYEPTIEYRHKLHRLTQTLASYEKNGISNPASSTSPLKTSLFSFVKPPNLRSSLALTPILPSHTAALEIQSPKGLMLHGSVGTGKSLLLDLFFSCLPTKKKARWHFNTFMLSTISALEKQRTVRLTTSSDFGFQDEYVLLSHARHLIETSPILFLDEFQFPDRAAAKILSNLLTAFFQLGGVLIASSNRMPEELEKAAGLEFQRPVGRFGGRGWRGWVGGGRAGWVKGGADGPGQKGEFAAFLEVLRGRCEVWEMEGKRDYRRLERDGAVNEGKAKEVGGLIGREDFVSTSGEVGNISQEHGPCSSILEEESDVPTTISHFPKYYLSSPTAEELQGRLHTATATPSTTPIPWTPLTLHIYARPLTIPSQHNGVALLPFSFLCGTALGPADYISIASTFHTICITSIPAMTWSLKNEARRFITFLDAAYEARCRLLITVDPEGRSAEIGPDELFFPESKNHTSSSTTGTPKDANYDPTHSETYSEIHQDLTSPFRPNISSYNPLRPDALEDDPAPPFRQNAPKEAEGGSAVDFTNLSGLTGEDEKFAVARARSRVWEMCSARWWEGRESDEDEDLEHESKAANVTSEVSELPVSAPKWWRPLSKEARHWERFTEAPTSSSTTHPSLQPDPSALSALSTSPNPAQPNPPNISWTHIWGTVKWGKRAGTWGKGVEGVEERRHEKKVEVQGKDVKARGKEH